MIRPDGTEPNEAAPIAAEPEAILVHQSVEDFALEPFESAEEPEYRVPPGELPAAIEAVLFASGEPLGIERLCEATGHAREDLLSVLAQMAESAANDPRRGLLVREAEGSWFLSTKPTAAEPLRRLYQPRTRPPLSQAAYETLAIIAYNQPATRAQVESVRGVSSDSIVARLIERGFVREAGTLDAPGRPTLFETTEEFLQEFGLRSVRDLPSMEMMMYGTLREIEVQLEEAAGNRRDNQITIDQIAPPGAIPEPPAPLPEADLPPADPEEVLELSEALFGTDADADVGTDGSSGPADA